MARFGVCSFTLRGLTIALTLLAVQSALAGVTVTLDAAALNVLLPAFAPSRIQVPLGESSKLDIELSDLRVTGFSPSGGAAGNGAIRAAVHVRAPQLGLDLALEPRLLPRVVVLGDERSLELRFDNLSVPLPLAGSIDLGSLVRPLLFPAETLSEIDAARTPTWLRTRLVQVLTGAQGLRLELDLEVVDAPTRATAGSR